MSKLRILLADDSSVARSVLRAMLEAEHDIEVVGEAVNGRQAIEQVDRLRPDLLTLDLEMPVMGGLETIEELMATNALPILVVSSVANAQNAYEAVARGALDVVAKPEIGSALVKELVGKVRLLARVRVITHLRPGRGKSPAGGAVLPRTSGAASVSLPPAKPGGEAMSSGSFHTDGLPGVCRRVIAIASSTGGPQVLARLLARLPADFAVPVLIAQHISDGFVTGMVEWLGGLCRIPVRIGIDGEMLRPGVVYVSPSERHMTVNSARRIALVERGIQDTYRPSCDALLSSVATVFRDKAVGVILTGMGRDGVKGMAAVRKLGGATLAQDEASSVVFGMNRAAFDEGAVQRLLDVDALIDELLRLGTGGAGAGTGQSGAKTT